MWSGCSLMERILLSQQQGVYMKDCGKRVFQQQEILNVSSVEAKMSKLSSLLLMQTRTYVLMWIACHYIASMSFNTSAKLLPNWGKSVRGNAACAAARNTVRKRAGVRF